MSILAAAKGEPSVNGGCLYRLSSIPAVQDGLVFLEANLQHSSAMVVNEAARALCHLPNASLDDVTAAIWVLRHLASSSISSSTPTIRTAALRCLASVAEQHPDVALPCRGPCDTQTKETNMDRRASKLGRERVDLYLNLLFILVAFHGPAIARVYQRARGQNRPFERTAAKSTGHARKLVSH